MGVVMWPESFKQTFVLHRLHHIKFVFEQFKKSLKIWMMGDWYDEMILLIIKPAAR